MPPGRGNHALTVRQSSLSTEKVYFCDVPGTEHTLIEMNLTLHTPSWLIRVTDSCHVPEVDGKITNRSRKALFKQPDTFPRYLLQESTK